MIGPSTRLAVAIAACASLAVLGIGLAAQVKRFPPGAVLLGQVVDAQTGRGLDRVVIDLDGAGLRRRLVSDSRGRFLFTGLPGGDYEIRARRTGYLDGAFGQRRAAGKGAPVSVVYGQWAGGLDVTLWRPAVISGDVRDDRGDPIVGVAVRAYKYDRLPDRATLREVASTNTDDEGRYRLSSLAPGDHLVGVSAYSPPRPADPDEPAGDEDEDEDVPPPPDLTFAPQYFPGADLVSGASPVTVEAGRESGNVSFTLPARPSFDVAGHVDLSTIPADLAGRLVVRLARPRDPRVAEPARHRVLAVTAPDADGAFRFARVPSGEFVIEASLPGATRTDDTPVVWALETIALVDRPLDDVVVSMQPGLLVEGQVLLDTRARAVPVPTGLSVTFESAFDPALPLERARVDSTGAFRTPAALLPGRYLVSVGGIPPGLMLRSVKSGGIDVADGGLDLSSGLPATDLLVELTDRVTVLTGVVRGTGPLADPLATVLLFPQDDRFVSDRRVRSTRANGEGAFTFRNLPEGRYLLVAIDDALADDWQAPDRLQALRPRGTPVLLREGETKVVELRRLPRR